MLIARKALVIAGAPFAPHDPIPGAVWEGLRRRTQDVLRRGRFVVDEPTAPAASAPEAAPVARRPRRRPAVED